MYTNYMTKANEHNASMIVSYEHKHWNACVVNAIHCAINCTDALTVFYIGFRHAGERHQDVFHLFQKLELNRKEFNDKSQQLASLLSIKNAAEYEERLMDQGDAENAKKACTRFYEWTKSKLS